jgi:hypothetical protein
MTSRPLWVGVVALCGTVGQATGQTNVPGGADLAVVVSPFGTRAEQDVPQDVRIMQTIVRTALSEVSAPELPGESAGDSAASAEARVQNLYLNALSGSSSFFGGGDASGFYMQGYGYLFTVRWPVSSLSAVRIRDVAKTRSGDVQVLSDPAQPSRAWAKQYRERLTNALRDVIAGYGNTLRRAGPGESITFIADFGGGDEGTVTLTVNADALRGSDVEANRGAIRISTGQGDTSERMRTQLKIMSQIIDTSLRFEAGDPTQRLLASTYYGGSIEPQYVPGYGVIFRKNARMSTARVFVARSSRPATRTAIDSTEAAAQTTYRAHIDTLRHKTAEILATYGPTLTEMKDDDWVGLYYDVGSAAALLNGGMDDFLVQARMRDIRQAAGQADPAGWLEQRVVTNEKEK